ncbi:MAG: CapA family protein [Thermoleophilia bacterium]|nr:CapA family protein [Thermoleophilia bacterium]
MKLVFVGDVMLGRLLNEILKRQPPEYPWGDTLPLFEDADLNICNLECVISDRGRPWSMTPKIFHFRSDAKNVEVLKAAGIDMVSLANNHALDYEYEALEDTFGILHDNGIAFAGAGSDLVAASSPYVREAEELRIGFIAFTDNEPDWAAGPDSPGVFYVPVDLEDERAQVLLDLVAVTSKRVDLLVVSAHWGPNWGYHPPPEQPAFARALVDAGAGMVFGHSGHVFRGVEFYKGRPVIYCAGNFIDDYAVNELERNDESFIFAAEERNGAIERLRLYPTIISEFQAIRATGSRQGQIVGKMSELCGEFGSLARWLPKQETLEIVPGPGELMHGAGE